MDRDKFFKLMSCENEILKDCSESPLYYDLMFQDFAIV